MAELGSQTGAISTVSSFVTAPISILPPVALPSRSQAVQPAARAGAEGASTVPPVAGVAPSSAVGVRCVGAGQIAPIFVDSDLGRIGIRGVLFLASAMGRLLPPATGTS